MEYPIISGIIVIVAIASVTDIITVAIGAVAN